MTPAQHRQAREIVNGYEDRHKHLRGYYSRTDLLTVAKLALARIIADCEAENGEAARKDVLSGADHVRTTEVGALSGAPEK